jgi:hypothetical protein
LGWLQSMVPGAKFSLSLTPAPAPAATEPVITVPITLAPTLPASASASASASSSASAAAPPSAAAASSHTHTYDAPALAFELLDLLHTLPHAPAPTVLTYELVAQVCRGDASRAALLLARMKQSGLTPNADIYSSVVRASAQRMLCCGCVADWRGEVM